MNFAIVCLTSRSGGRNPLDPSPSLYTPLSPDNRQEPVPPELPVLSRHVILTRPGTRRSKRTRASDVDMAGPEATVEPAIAIMVRSTIRLQQRGTLHTHARRGTEEIGISTRQHQQLAVLYRTVDRKPAHPPHLPRSTAANVHEERNQRCSPDDLRPGHGRGYWQTQADAVPERSDGNHVAVK